MIATTRSIVLGLLLTCALAGRTMAFQGIAHTDLHLEQYVMLDTSGVAVVFNTGVGPITVDSIVAVRRDTDYSVFASYRSTPFVMQPGERDTLAIRFQPNPYLGQPIASGRRTYLKQWIVYNSTGTWDTVTFTGRGHMVDMHTSIRRDYVAWPWTSVAPVSIVCDEWIDTLGTSDIRGFVLEVVHFKRTLVRPDVLYNRSGAGCENTLTAGASAVENVGESTQIDPWHNYGSQGYYELNVQFAPQNIGRVGTLLNLRFRTFQPFQLGIVDTDGQIVGPLPATARGDTLWAPMHPTVNTRWGMPRDTSEITYRISQFITHSPSMALYVNVTQRNGLITVACPADSTFQFNVYPNPFAPSSNVHFSVIATAAIHAELYDVIGRLVKTVIDGVVMGAGEYSIDLKSTPLVPGTYYLKISDGVHTNVIHIIRLAR